MNRPRNSRSRSAGLVFALCQAAFPAFAQTRRGEPPPPSPPQIQADRVAERAAKAPATALDSASGPSGNVFVPLLLYTPETHVGAGGLFVHFLHLGRGKNSRTSSLALLAIATTRGQALFEGIQDFYWLDDALHVFSKLAYQHYPDSFFGIGNDTRAEDEERYERQRLGLRGDAQYRLTSPIFAGLAWDLMAYTATYPDNEGFFRRGGVPGEGGGMTAGIGPIVTYDSRDNNVAARYGALLAARLLWFSHALGSRYQFRRLKLDARQFIQLWREHVLGLHLYAETEGGEVPYYQLAMLGGDDLVRGYYLGRFRDKNLAALDLEYRYPIFWRIGGVAFAGAGSVGKRFQDTFDNRIHWAVGAGLRFSLSSEERLNLRFDFGIGPGSYGFYFTAQEAF